MSQSEVDRFVADLKENTDLRVELKGAAAGVASVVAFAQGKGYDITVDEARGYIQAQTRQDLSDDQLEAIAGGKSHSTSTVVAQTIAVATTEAVTAETTAYTIAEAATTVGAAAEIGVVVAVVAVLT